jgi:group I intron endonuclease
MLYKSFLKYGYQSFTLEILEIVDVNNLNSTEARIMLLEREQYYIDLLKPEYNILKIAGSNLGKNLFPLRETRVFLSSKLDKKQKCQQKLRLPEGKKISQSKVWVPSHRKGLKGLEAFSAESIQKMSENSGMKKVVYVYDLNNVLLFPPFSSIKLCASSLGLSRFQISRSLDKDKAVGKYIFVSKIKAENS